MLWRRDETTFLVLRAFLGLTDLIKRLIISERLLIQHSSPSAPHDPTREQLHFNQVGNV